jgi:hypothetical protein
MRKEKALKGIRVYLYDILSRIVIKYCCQNPFFYLIIAFRKGDLLLPVVNHLWISGNKLLSVRSAP